MIAKKVLAGILCLVFIGTAFSVAVQGSTPVVKTKAVTGDRLYVAMQQDMPNFNYFDLGSNSVWKSNVIGWCFASLSALDTDGTVYPSMAQNWTFDQTHLTVMVKVRDGITFNDGTPLTLQDILFSYEALRNGTTVSQSLIDAFSKPGETMVSKAEIDAGVQIMTNNYIKFTMGKPYAMFFMNALGLPIIPKAVWSNHLTSEGCVDVTWGTDPAATTGTGSYVYTSGSAQVYRLITRYEGYFGKNLTTPAGANTWPGGVREIYFKIYSNIDTAVLALESGEVDYIAWAVTSGKIPELQANPHTQVTFMPDNGYFYLAFNEKKEPVNMLPFRQAVSHVIDKTYAVSTYMGGYGVEGDSSEPPFWTQWYNSSVEHQTFSLDEAKSILDAAGFKVNAATGFRTMPNGNAIPQITILTPPSDYDPIRIKIGTMIATNLRAIGIDAKAQPVDFDTLVAKMNAFDYSMLIIGWTLGSDPIGNVFDILGPTASQNTFGFWSHANPNPFYQTKGGGGPDGTLADAQTQAYADQVMTLENLAKGSFNTAEQIKYTKEAQGIISKAIPVNILYYRVNAEGSSKSWTGWTPFMGSLFNTYTLANLARTAPPVITGNIAAVFNAPAKVAIGGNGAAGVYVFNNIGLPVKGATVTLTSTSSNVIFPATGTTGTNGQFAFNVTGAMEGLATINAKVVSGSLTANTTATVQAYGTLPKYLYLTATPAKNYIAAGQTDAIALQTKDENGNPVGGASILVDPNQLKLGSVDQTNLTTDANGAATITYTAPTFIGINQHLNPTVSMQASKAGYGFGANVQLNLVIINSAASNWQIVSITGASRIACSAANPSTTINITAGASETLTVAYSNSSLLSSPTTTVTTDATGKGSLTITFASTLTATAALHLSFQDLTSPYSISDSATILYKGTTVPSGPIYGGIISFSAKTLDPFGNLTITTELRDLNDAVPTTTVMAGMCVAGTPDGELTSVADLNFDSNWDYAGVLTASTLDETQLSASGPFGCDVNPVAETPILQSVCDANGITYGSTWASLWENWSNWEYGSLIPTPASVPLVNGTGTFMIQGSAASLRDLADSVIIMPNAYATFDGSNWMMTGNTTISSQFVILRGQNIITASYDVATPVISSAAAPMNTTVAITAYDQTNTAVPGASVSAYAIVRTASTYQVTSGGSGTTDATGKKTVTVTINYAKLNSAGFGTGTLKTDMFVKAAMPGYVTVLQVTQIVITPALIQLGLSTGARVEVTSTAAKTVAVTATASLPDGTPVPGANVTMSSSLGTIAPAYILTDSNGKATFNLTFSVAQFTTFPYLFITVKGSVQATKSQGTGGQYQFEVYGTTPTISITSPVNGATISTGNDNTTVSIVGTVTDSKTVTELWIRVDGGVWVKQTITSGASVPFTYTQSVSTSSDGQNHSFDIKAVDSLNISATSSLFVIAKKTTSSSNNMILIAVVIVIIIAIVIVAVLMMMRKKKPETTTPEAQPAAPAEAAPPEQTPPAQQPPAGGTTPPQ